MLPVLTYTKLVLTQSTGIVKKQHIHILILLAILYILIFIFALKLLYYLLQPQYH